MLSPVHEWITKATNDLACAKSLLNLGDEYYNQICFLTQQAIEKLLKAYLIKNDKELTKTHDLVKLNSDCMEINSAFAQWKEAALTLTIYSVDFRYPGEDATKTEAIESVSLAEEIFKFIIEELKK